MTGSRSPSPAGTPNPDLRSAWWPVRACWRLPALPIGRCWPYHRASRRWSSRSGCCRAASDTAAMNSAPAGSSPSSYRSWRWQSSWPDQDDAGPKCKIPELQLPHPGTGVSHAARARAGSPRRRARELLDRVGDGVRARLRDVFRRLGLHRAFGVGRGHRADERIPQQRRLALLHALEHDLVALHDVVEPKVADRGLTDEFVAQARAQVARPAAARAARERDPHAHADAAAGQRFAARGPDDAVLLAHRVGLRALIGHRPIIDAPPAVGMSVDRSPERD